MVHPIKKNALSHNHREQKERPARARSTRREDDLESWILVHSYLKTVTHKLPKDWKVPRGYREKESEKDRYYLYKGEVLLNYFSDLTPSHKKAFDYRRESFKKSKEYSRALAKFKRSIYLLIKRAYIEDRQTHYTILTTIALTELGKQKAKLLLKMCKPSSPHPQVPCKYRA